MSEAYTSGSHQAAAPLPSEAEQRSANASVGELLGEVTKDLSKLMRQEVALAKAEATESAKDAGKGAGMFAGAAVGGHFVLLFLSLALMWGLDALMPIGWAAVIVAVIWGIIAAVLAMQGKKEMKKVKGLPQTAETVKEIPPTLKPGEHTR
ncbi:phage holin family protein [Arthrobacter sp. NamB2]|uniref:phage holin family protein n=1 Tax=unclassified Arthrobacter TaxID=235627 RepID=UPI000CE45ADA|nr:MULTISPECIES: phage holin family protein [unclassified Arthrobacter]TKV29047.1 phage holin family protein [Arthrobacter sp. NamB2]